MRWIPLISVLAVIASGCAGGPAAPTTATALTPAQSQPLSTRGNLTITSVAVSDAGQDALGHWQYKVIVHLRETAGVDLTATYIYVQALSGSNILATYGSGTWLSVSANSSSDAGLVLAADTHVGDLSALTLVVTVQFQDRNGRTGCVGNTSSSAGCWDY
jgi:hypothetical protein